MAEFKAYLTWKDKDDQLNPPIRNIHVPDEFITGNIENDLEMIFRYGQNMFQSQNMRSLSSGDVVELYNKKYICDMIGWKEDLSDVSFMVDKENKFIQKHFK